MKIRILAGLAVSLFLLGGCEDEGDTTIVYEGDDIVMSTNSPGIVIKDNDGSVTVTQTTSEDGYTPTVVVSGNTGKVYVATQPQQPPQPEGSTDE